MKVKARSPELPSQGASNTLQNKTLSTDPAVRWGRLASPYSHGFRRVSRRCNRGVGHQIFDPYCIVTFPVNHSPMIFDPGFFHGIRINGTVKRRCATTAH